MKKIKNKNKVWGKAVEGRTFKCPINSLKRQTMIKNQTENYFSLAQHKSARVSYVVANL